MTKKISNYEERIVLFLDILGFKGLIKDSIEDAEKFQKIRTLIRVIRNVFNITQRTKERAITQFSDSLIVSFKITEKGEVAFLLAKTHELIKRLVLHEIVCRGGIAKGQLIHDHIFMFGQAFIDAYNLESKLAIFPRVIIVNESIITLGKKYYGYHPANNSIYEDKELKSFTSMDFDGYTFIDYFNSGTIWEMSAKDKFYIKKLRKLIVIQLQLNENKPYIKQKYEWMKDKFNERVKEIKTDKRIEIAGFKMGSDKSSKFYRELKPIE